MAIHSVSVDLKILPIICFVDNVWLKLIIATAVGATFFGSILIYSKDDMVLGILKYITKR